MMFHERDLTTYMHEVKITKICHQAILYSVNLHGKSFYRDLTKFPIDLID